MGRGRSVGYICDSHHVYVNTDKGEVCEACKNRAKDAIISEFNANVNTERWIGGWWKDLDTDPVYIKNKDHLRHELEIRGKGKWIPKAFIKPKSQGKGYESKL